MSTLIMIQNVLLLLRGLAFHLLVFHLTFKLSGPRLEGNLLIVVVQVLVSIPLMRDGAKRTVPVIDLIGAGIVDAPFCKGFGS